MEKKINVAVIGGSEMARLHMDGVIANENANLYALCDIHEEILNKNMEDKGVTYGVTDYKELVNDPNLDAVVLVVPDGLHLEMTSAFLRAGKAVLCEKPMTLNLADCEKMMQVEKETNGKLMIGQICRCTPGFMMAKQLVDEGKIGELFFVESEYAHNYDEVAGVDNWRMSPDRDGFIGGGCHAVDLLRWIAGDPTEVCAYANHKNLLNWPTNDTTIAIYKFPNNVIGKVFASTGVKRDYTMRTVLYGTKGTIICDNTSPTITLYSEDEQFIIGKPDYTKGHVIPVIINNHNATAEIEAFVNALANNDPMPVPSMEGASTVAVACATVEAAKNGSPVTIKYPEVK